MTDVEKKCKEFDEKFVEEGDSALVEAIEEEREKLRELIKSNSKGSFIDDAGHDCWYVDDLLALLNK